MFAGLHLQFQHPYLVGVVFLLGVDEFHEVVGAYGAVHDAEIRHNAAERVEHRVEDKGLQRSFGVALGCGNAVHNGVEQVFHAVARFCAYGQYVVVAAADEFHNLVGDLFHHGVVEVYLVEHGNYLEVVVEGEVKVGDGLSLDALRGVHHEQCAFAGGDGTGDFVGEVHVARSVDKVE